MATFDGTFGSKEFGEAKAEFGGQLSGNPQISFIDSAVGDESFSITTAFATTATFLDSAVGSEIFTISQPTPTAIVTSRVEIHDPTTQALIEILENAYNVGYELAVNYAPIAHFSLPRDDIKWPAVQAFREVWIYDAQGQIVDIFRVMPFQEFHNDQGRTTEVKCEGYATVLQDDLVSSELIWTNVSVTQILNDLLAYQTTPRVSLGFVDPALNLTVGGFRVAYDNVMKGCWEVRNLVGGYISVDPVVGQPSQRRLNLQANPGQDIGQRVSQGFNLRGIGRTTDPTQAVTKVFPLGRGEGINQQRPSTDILLAQPVAFTAGGGSKSTLVISDNYSRYKGFTSAGQPLPNGQTTKDTRVRPMKVWRNGIDDSTNWEQGADERTIRSTVVGYNPGGSWALDYVHADYLVADDVVGTYGTIAQALPDKRFESSIDLVRAARVALDLVKLPRVSYDVKVADVARLYPTESFERLHLNDQIQVTDTVIGVATKLRIVKLTYGDMWKPDTMSITVGTLEPTLEQVLLQDRQRQYATMADGATNIWVDSFEDNLDSSHPYTRDIYIPPDAVSVNKVSLNVRLKNYRYYVSTVVSAEGGIHSHSYLNLAGSTDVGGPANTDSGTAHTTDAQGVHTHTDPQGGDTGTSVSHSHNVNGHTHGDLHVHAPSGGGNFVIGNPNNTTQAAAHSHTVTVTPGIIETTTPGTLQVDVDGNVASFGPTNLQELDLTAFLAKNSDGKITRGWHTVKFSAGNGRVQGSLVIQVFLQSRGVVAG